MKKKIKLMAEYFSYPLWILNEGLYNPVNPEELGLSKETTSQLKNWSDKYDSKLNLENPKNSVFFNSAELLSFEEEGLNLWLKLIEELSPEYEVEYFSVKEQKVLKQNS